MSQSVIEPKEFEKMEWHSRKKTNPSAWLTSRRAIKAFVWAKTNGMCWYCADPMNPFKEFTIDHIIPLSRGGMDSLDNYAPCCRSCNSKKKDGTVEQLREKLCFKGKPKFSEEQRAYLTSLQISLPTPPPTFQFAFERMGWTS